MKYLFGTLLGFCLLATACKTNKSDNATDTPAKVTTLILVRHAEKGDDGTQDPELSTEGQIRAQKLAKMLASAEVGAVFSTPYKRTRSTARPLAELAGLSVQEYDPRNPEFTSKLLEEHAGETVLIVGHSNTIPGMVNQLIGTATYGNLDEMEYDKLFIVHVAGGQGDALVLSY